MTRAASRASHGSQDERYMRLALALARRGLGETSPNPVVGAVVVAGGRIVGRGYHRRAGGPHAEAAALRHAGPRARGATLYVTLEPCNHTGHTPPCCDAILDAGIARVVAAMKDPNPLTNGRGIRRLRRAGVRVTTGVLDAEARRLNAPFVKCMTARMPWVVAKIAQSLDGKIATTTGQSQWISSPQARRFAHQLRRDADAVVIGVNSVLTDDPLLTARDPDRPARRRRPVKIIVDSRLRTPLARRCFSSASPAPTIVATTVTAARKRAALARRGVTVLTLPPSGGRVPLAKLFRLLARRYELTSVLIEGGGELLAGALAERLVDRLVCITAPMVIGGKTAPSSVGGPGVPHLREAIRLTGSCGLADPCVYWIGTDLVIDAAVVYPRSGSRAHGLTG